MLLDLLFPKRCLHCRAWGDFLCSACLKQIKYLEEQYCPACHRRSVLGYRDHGCRQRSSIDQLYSLCWYGGATRSLIGKFKFYPPIRGAAVTLDNLIQNGLAGEDLSGWHRSIVVPVPLHWQRRQERGFNQSEFLAQSLARFLGTRHMPDLLIRQRKTTAQSSLQHDKREQNVKNVFALNATSWHGAKEVILVDDVYTTGSTLESCASVLKKSGVERIVAFTLTRG